MSDIDNIEVIARRLGKYLVCSPAVLKNAVKKQGQMLKRGATLKPIGTILVDDGVITQEELDMAIRRQRVDRLKRCPVFSMLSDAELSAMSNRFSEVVIDPGKQFITQDEPDPTLFIMVEGKVEVYRTTLDGEHIHIAYVEPPQPIGEMGYFQGSVRTASVKAIELTVLLKAEYSALTHYFEYVPRVAHEFMRIVEQRRHETEQIVQQQAG